MENRMTYLQQNHPKWCNGYLLMENGHCLIEDEEGDIMLPESLQSSMICLKEKDRWTKGELLGSVVLCDNGKLMEVKAVNAFNIQRLFLKDGLICLCSYQKASFIRSLTM